MTTMTTTASKPQAKQGTALLDAWLDAMRTQADIDEALMEDLSRDMSHSLHVRDAILCSMTGYAGRDDLVRIATRPHEPATRDTVSRILTAAFDHGATDTARDTLAWGIEQLDHTARHEFDTGHDVLASQPLAALAWAAWLSGDDSTALNAATCAVTAEDDDEENSLARIIIAVVMDRFSPSDL